MRIGIICFSKAGEALSKEIKQGLMAKYKDCHINMTSKFKSSQSYMEMSAKEWTKERFKESDLIIFIGAVGIAVRNIADFVKTKTEDPAVVVVDDGGNFAISLLSGHLGGGNDYTRVISSITGAIPVITTATDVHRKFSPDIFAKKNNLAIDDLPTAKKIAALALEEKPIYIASDFEISGSIKGLEIIQSKDIFLEKALTGIIISTSITQKKADTDVLWLVPKCIYVGIGCKKGTTKDNIAAAIKDILKKEDIDFRAIKSVSSIDLKKHEEGIAAFCDENNIPYITYKAEELNKLSGDFTPSEFVQGITGVDNVCERSAIMSLENDLTDGEESLGLIVKKYAFNGITLAMAMKKWSVSYE